MWVAGSAGSRFGRNQAFEVALGVYDNRLQSRERLAVVHVLADQASPRKVVLLPSLCPLAGGVAPSVGLHERALTI